VEEDIEEMRAEERAQQSESSISIMELICSPTLRAPLIIGIVMQLSQQLSGINAVSTSHCAFSYWCSIVQGNGLMDPFFSSAAACLLQVFYYSTSLFMSSGLTEESAKFATIGIGCIMVTTLLDNNDDDDDYDGNSLIQFP